MAKYLNLTGLTTFWTKVKTWVSSAVTTNSPSASKTVTGWNEGKITYGNIQISESQVTNLTTHLNAKAPLASPALTGTPTAPTAATGTNTTQIATTAFVNAEIEAKMGEADAMVYKGTLAGGSTGAYGALTPAANKGYTYKVTTAGLIDGVRVEVGDMLICNTDDTAAATANNYSTVAANWDFIQGNTDGVVVGPSSATSGNVALFDGTTGKLIKDSGKTLGKSVPSDAVFTDQSVTAVGNHYAPTADASSALSASASGATAAWSIDVVKGVTISRDAKGHVTGVSVTSGKIPANPNTDTKVTQNSNSENKEFPLLAKFTNNTTNETNTVKYAAGVTVNPSTNTISGNLYSAGSSGSLTISNSLLTAQQGTNKIVIDGEAIGFSKTDSTGGTTIGVDGMNTTGDGTFAGSLSAGGRSADGTVTAVANSTVTWAAATTELLLTQNGNVTVNLKNLQVGKVYWLHKGRSGKVSLKNESAWTLYIYDDSFSLSATDTFELEDNIRGTLHTNFSVAVIRSSANNFYVLMTYGATNSAMPNYQYDNPDWNDLNSRGFYSITNSAAAGTNHSPESGRVELMTVSSVDSVFKVQIAMGAKIYARKFSNNQWYAWTTIATLSNQTS